MYADKLDGKITETQYENLKDGWDHEIALLEESIQDIQVQNKELSNKISIILELCNPPE